MTTQTLPCLTEHQEQAILISLCDKHKATYPDAVHLFAIPNAGGYKGGYKSNGGHVSKMLVEGMRPGVPDLFLPSACGGYHGLFVEMKRVHGGVVSPQQKEWHAILERKGYLVAIASGANDAWLMIRNYLDGNYRVGEIAQ